jgi:hypothetical protein
VIRPLGVAVYASQQAAKGKERFNHPNKNKKKL